MDSKLDKLIEETLKDEDKAFLERMGEEPGYFDLAKGIFKGRLGWVSSIQMVMQFVFLIGGIYCAVAFFQATDVLTALQWGLPALFLLIGQILIKSLFWPSMQTDRMLREIKRLELQIAHLSAKH